MVGGGGGGGDAVPCRPKKTTVTKPYIAVSKKDLLFLHIELSKGVNNAKKVVCRCFRYLRKI